MSKLVRVQRVVNKKTGKVYTYQYTYEVVNGKKQRKATKVLVTKSGKINRKNLKRFIDEIDKRVQNTGKFTKENIIAEAKAYVEARSKLNKSAVTSWDKHRITETSIITHLTNQIKASLDIEYEINSIEVFLLNAGVTKKYLADKYNIEEKDINDSNIKNGILTVADKSGILRKFMIQFNYNNDAVLIEI